MLRLAFLGIAGEACRRWRRRLAFDERGKADAFSFGGMAQAEAEAVRKRALTVAEQVGVTRVFSARSPSPRCGKIDPQEEAAAVEVLTGRKWRRWSRAGVVLDWNGCRLILKEVTDCIGIITLIITCDTILVLVNDACITGKVFICA